MFNIEENWKEKLKASLECEDFIKLTEFVESEYKTKTVYPAKENIFRSLNTIPYDDVKVVILGQDPYHGAGQANGFAFAVDKGIPLPPSLKNIMQELRTDIVLPIYGTAENARAQGVSLDRTLVSWAEQGVLLLNATLTVCEGCPLSHSRLGWEKLTDDIIAALAMRAKPMVFILWGANAIKKEVQIGNNHFIIKSPHPSPLSAHRGFFGSKPFSRANEFLKEKGLEPISWVNKIKK